jgi:hypothetical protein
MVNAIQFFIMAFFGIKESNLLLAEKADIKSLFNHTLLGQGLFVSQNTSFGLGKYVIKCVKKL